MLRGLALALLLLGAGCVTTHVQAQSDDAAEAISSSPYAPDVRRHYYEFLAKSPAKAALWELALPGAGSVYTGLRGLAIATGVISLAGAGLWIAGAATDRDDLWWAGAGTFAGGRVFGLVGAPVGALLLNAAYRRQLGVSGSW